MPFEPRSGKHAIAEVVFGLLFSRRFRPPEIDSVIASHQKWAAALPRLGRTNMVQFGIGEGETGPLQMALPAAGIVFDAVKRDGTLEQRLRVDENCIYVNCLTYNRWAEAYGMARQLFRDVCAAAWKEPAVDHPQVTACMLQYVDIFDWQGDSKQYDIDELLRTDGRFVPPALRARGPLWHLHQGWFRTDDLILDGRLLERINLDAALDDATQQPVVKMDTFHRLDFKEPQLIADFVANDAKIDGVFDWLHRADKSVVGGYLTDQMIERIGLKNGPGAANG